MSYLSKLIKYNQFFVNNDLKGASQILMLLTLKSFLMFLLHLLNFVIVVNEPYPARSTYQVAKLPLVIIQN